MPFYENIEHKQGATFRRILNIGNPLETDTTVTAQADQDGTVYNFNVRKLSPFSDGYIELEISDSDTQNWTPGTILYCDVRSEYANGDIAKTETFRIVVKEGITADS